MTPAAPQDCATWHGRKKEGMEFVLPLPFSFLLVKKIIHQPAGPWKLAESPSSRHRGPAYHSSPFADRFSPIISGQGGRLHIVAIFTRSHNWFQGLVVQTHTHTPTLEIFLCTASRKMRTDVLEIPSSPLDERDISADVDCISLSPTGLHFSHTGREPDLRPNHNGRGR
jgi:hypothetical protein